MTPEELEKLPKPLERTMTALEMDIMLEVVNRIRECSQITPVTDWLLNRMTAIGMSKKRIKEILREGVKTAGIDIDEIYETAARSDYVRNSEIYKAAGMDAIPYEDNDWLKQVVQAVKDQTTDSLRPMENITKTTGFNGVISKVEEDGYMATGALAAMGMRAKLRGIKATDGTPIFKSDMQGSTNYALDGAPMYFPQNGAYDNSIAQLIVGDFKQAVYAIRQDVTVKILDQGVIQDPITKDIVYNLAQQDMVALRIVFRMGWALPNPATRIDEDRVGCPFAYLEPATPVTTQTVTFTVKDNASSPVAIEDAIVDVNGSRLKTNASGKAVFNLRPGTYPAKIKKTGYSQITENVTVVASAVTKDVTLIKNA